GPHQLPERLGLVSRCIKANSRQQPGELLAAETCSESAARLRPPVEQRADDTQRLVSVLMSLRIVQRLEVIEIDEDERHLRSFRARVFQRLVEAAPVGDAR